MTFENCKKDRMTRFLYLYRCKRGEDSYGNPFTTVAIRSIENNFNQIMQLVDFRAMKRGTSMNA